MLLPVRHLLCCHSCASFDKQLHLSEVVGDSDWHFDVGKGLLSFNADHSWDAQVLGTESEATHTWLWSWANTASNLPPEVIEAAEMMRVVLAEILSQVIPETSGEIRPVAMLTKE